MSQKYRGEFGSEPGTNPESPSSKMRASDPDHGSWRWQIEARVGRVEDRVRFLEDQYKPIDQKLNALVHAETVRSTREVTVEKLQKEQKAFTMWMVPLIISLIVSIIGATAYLAMHFK